MGEKALSNHEGSHARGHGAGLHHLDRPICQKLERRRRVRRRPEREPCPLLRLPSTSMHIRRISITLLTFLVAAAVAGCGGGSSTNGVESKSAAGIVSAAQSAASKAKYVHVSGSVETAGTSLDLDLHLAQGKGAKGKISQGGLSFELIRFGNTAYINGSASFYERFGGKEAAKLLKGKWLKAPATSGEFSTLGSLTDLRQLINAALGEHGKLEKGSTTTIEGQTAIEVKDVTHGGTLYVATTGKPYPIEIKGSGAKSSGTVKFGEWNEEFTLEAPSKSIDITKLKEAG